MRLGVLLAVISACVLLWAGLPLPTSGQSLRSIEGKIEHTRGKIGRKKGTEHVLASDIASYTRRIDHLQTRISSLEHRQLSLQSDLDRKRAELEQIQARLRAQRLAALESRAQSIAAAILRRREEVRTVKEDLIGTRVGYANTRADKQHALVKVRDERVNLEGHLTALVSEQRRIQAKLAAVSQQAGSTRSLPVGPIKGGSGQLIWPVNGPITSPFCERRAWEACHPGIDIGVPAGTPIRAADSGRVVIAGWTGGYGNYTCIQHTSSLSSCYGHQSAILVSVGQNVSQGQVIGRSGCTRLCFGAHLHFEVRINGAVTNPLNYL